MPRIAGVDIPNEKRTIIALTYIFGVGPSRAKDICAALNLEPAKKSKELTDEELAALASHLQQEYDVEGNLRRATTLNINRLRDISSYRGNRHRRGLPVRGQRTRTNARSRKGAKKTVAGKKSVKALK